MESSDAEDWEREQGRKEPLHLVEAWRGAEDPCGIPAVMVSAGATCKLAYADVEANAVALGGTVYVYDQLGRLVPDYPYETVDGEGGRVFRLELTSDHCMAIVREGV